MLKIAVPTEGLELPRERQLIKPIPANYREEVLLNEWRKVNRATQIKGLWEHQGDARLQAVINRAIDLNDQQLRGTGWKAGELEDY